MSPIRDTEQDKYPKDWVAIRSRILVRAEGRCEFTCVDGTAATRRTSSSCFARSGTRKLWRTPHDGDCGESDLTATA
jgi:hypothetical protein